MDRDVFVGVDDRERIITQPKTIEEAKDTIFFTIIDALNDIEMATTVSVQQAVIDCGEMGICRMHAADGVWCKKWEKQTEAVPLAQYVEKQIQRIFEDIAAIYDSEGETEEEAACVPSAIFAAQQHLIDAWRKYQEGGK